MTVMNDVGTEVIVGESGVLVNGIGEFVAVGGMGVFVCVDGTGVDVELAVNVTGMEVGGATVTGIIAGL